MNYADARPRIRSGDLLAWSHRGWRTFYDFEVQMVRVFTRSEYCHVAIAWECAARVFALEAVQAGVRIFPLSRLAPFYWLPTGAAWLPQAEEFALSKVGERYSKFQAALAFLDLLPPEPDARWQCAEYAAAVLARAGHAWTIPVDKTPSKLVRAAQERVGAPIYYVDQGA